MRLGGVQRLSGLSGSRWSASACYHGIITEALSCIYPMKRDAIQLELVFLKLWEIILLYALQRMDATIISLFSY
jgi:hypothetical protein